MVCALCENGWHIDCLVPPLSSVPSVRWYCPPCVPLALVRSEKEKKRAKGKRSNKKVIPKKAHPVKRSDSHESSDNDRLSRVSSHESDDSMDSVNLVAPSLSSSGHEVKKKVTHGNPLDTISTS